ncbi:MAG TPA: glycosyltransferase [Vicinamibacterales bacterium]|nr:glycosyltransferase [Vicinamibacterales bacterium]
MPRIPIAIFLTSFHPGGTERQMTELIRGLDRTRFDVHVACFHREGAWLPRVTACAPVTAFPIRGFARPSTVGRMAAFARWCRSHRIAVVQTCDLYANTFGLPAAALAGVRVRIGSRRELNPDKRSSQIALQRQAYRAATRVVANSAAAARQLETEGVPSSRIRVIPNGVALERFEPHTFRGPVTTVTTIANLREEKAHEVLLCAAAILRERHPRLRYVVAGDGPRRAALERMAADLGIGDRVDFLGHREDVPELLARTDVYVLPSRSEAFPNGAIEAMAAGVPVVASAVGGLLDLIEDGRTGVLVPVGDPQALAAALDGLAESPAHAAALGRAARAEVERRYRFDRMVAAFERLYFDELGAPRATAPAAA